MAPIEMSPNLKTSRGGQAVGKDMDERRGAEARRGDDASKEGRYGFAGRSRDSGNQLSADEANPEAIPEAGRQRAGAWQRRQEIQPSEAEEVSGSGAAPGGAEVFGGSGRAIRADA